MTDQIVLGITESIRTGDTGGYTKTDIAGDLAWVQKRIAWMKADLGDWSTRIAEYQACADELQGVLADPEYAP